MKESAYFGLREPFTLLQPEGRDETSLCDVARASNARSQQPQPRDSRSFALVAVTRGPSNRTTPIPAG
jgi:hypothetical protein